MKQDCIILFCGLHSLAFAAFHLMFWRIFQWKKNLADVGISTRAILQIANLQLIWVFLGVAGLCFWYPDELLHTPLGHAVLLGMSVFWIIRAANQFIFLRYNFWYIHLLTAFFLLGAILFSLPLV